MVDKKVILSFLLKGEWGASVTLIQAILLFGGFNPKIVADGHFGDETEKGVRGFQKSLGLEETGIFASTEKEGLKSLVNSWF